MLCDDCRLHFDLSAQDYATIKETTISSLRVSGVNIALLQLLLEDLHSYRAAKRNGSLDVCPWIPLSDVLEYVLEEDLSQMEAPELDVWVSALPRKDVKSTAEMGCDMCLRICEAVQSLGYEYESLDLDSWLVLDPVTLFPREIKIQVENSSLDFTYLRFKIAKDTTESM